MDYVIENVFNNNKKEDFINSGEGSIRAITKRFEISPNTVYRWLKRIEPRLKRNKESTKIDMELLKLDLLKYKDAYNYERAIRLGVSTSCIRYALRRLGVSYKKSTNSSKIKRRISYIISRED